MADRTPREAENRDGSKRQSLWSRPSALPTPDPRDGLCFRWIRTATLGNSDNRNVSMRFREGYVPVQAKDHPELMVLSDQDSRFKGNIEVGGLLLCSIPAEIVEDRTAQMQHKAKSQIESVDRHFLNESDPRMPVLRPERSTRISSSGK